MTTRLVAAIVVLCAVTPNDSWAYRPFESTDAAVAAKGELELELGPVGFVALPGQRFLVAPGAIINLGLLHNWELVLQGRHLILLDDRAGEPRLRLVDTGVFIKGVLREGSLQEGRGPSVAVEAGPLLPEVNRDRGVGVSGAAIVSQRFAPVTFHVNGAVALSRAHHLDLFGGHIVEGPHRWPVRPVAEVLVERELTVATTVSGLVGAIWRLRDNLSFDLAGRMARVGNDNVYEVRAGLTWAVTLWRTP
ncbi:MAG: hypothetical protein HY906_03270 [Deltaproteobacteria bacterium]|nr:hypothetical protein [Deltaproteobacteria bacterium]